jgi:hypothetical protein
LHEPVHQRGFIEAVHAIKRWFDPIVALHHLAGGSGKTRLIAIHQRQLRSARQVHRQHQKNEQPRGEPIPFPRFFGSVHHSKIRFLTVL